MDVRGKRVVVTGATGFVGSHLCEALLARGARVVGAVRDPAKGAWLEALGVQLVHADLGDEASLVRAFAGADAVIANAALSVRGRRPSYREFDVANREGALRQAEATARAAVPRLVYISTVAVYRPRLWARHGHDGLLLDGIPLSPTFVTTNWRYAVTKARGEQAVWSTSQARGLATTALRAGPIYGSRDTKLTATYARAMARPVALAPTTRVPHVHARDLAEAAVGALATPASAGRAYNVTGELTSPLDLLRTWRRLVGSGPRLVPVPVPVWLDFDDAPARRDLGFAPRPLEAGLREVLAALNR